MSGRRRAGPRDWLIDLLAANSFDVVSIRIKHERPIVIAVIVRAQPRLPVVLSAGRERGLVKSIHGLPVLGRKGDMGACLRLASAADPEKGLPVGAIARESVLFGMEPFDAERT